jgi:hypothetical protein
MRYPLSSVSHNTFDVPLEGSSFTASNALLQSFIFYLKYRMQFSVHHHNKQDNRICLFPLFTEQSEPLLIRQWNDINTRTRFYTKYFPTSG